MKVVGTFYGGILLCTVSMGGTDPSSTSEDAGIQ